MGKISTAIPHPPWATHACRGFYSIKYCRRHADKNAPGKDYGIREIVKKDKTTEYEWYWPKKPPIHPT